jgi:hypothetical protein
MAFILWRIHAYNKSLYKILINGSVNFKNVSVDVTTQKEFAQYATGVFIQKFPESAHFPNICYLDTFQLHNTNISANILKCTESVGSASV